MNNKKNKVVQVNEAILVDLINEIVEKTIAERNLIPGPTVKKAPRKLTVTESQLRQLQSKGAKINSIVKKTK
jgi:hypothetical protein